MKRLVPLESVVVVRDGKRITPPLNQPYDFTDAEADALAASRPEAVRKPVNEGEVGDEMLDLPEDDGGEGDDAIHEANATAAQATKRRKAAKKIAAATGVKVDDL